MTAVKITLLILLGLILFLAQHYLDIGSYFNPENIKVWLNEAGSLAPILFMLIMAAAIVISPIPSLPLDVAGGGVFGPFWGTLYASVGALVGAMISFLIARALGRDLIARFLGGHINFCTECSNRLLIKIVFLSRLLPVISFDVVSYGAGLTKMSLSKFSLATFFGMLPLTFVYTYYGSILTFGAELPIILGVVMVILFFLVPRWIEKYNLFSLRKFFQHGQNSNK
jgi:uncharacterized membrane protein YdjX (TVP38/TMEM64 family)